MAIQFFISHSSIDQNVRAIVSPIQTTEIIPYFAEDQPAEPVSLHEKLIAAISNSKGAFIFITRNAIENSDTRDMILWELGVIHAHKIPAYVFTEEGVYVPKPARFASTSYNFNMSNIPSLVNISKQITDIASRIASTIRQKETDERNKMIIGGIALAIVAGLGAYLATRDR